MIETITRKQLYDLIWSKPLTKVQLELGLTYAQIRSICKELKIPIPGSGFWIKQQYGKPLTILPLVEDADIEEWLNKITEKASRSSTSTSKPAAKKTPAKKAAVTKKAASKSTVKRK